METIKRGNKTERKHLVSQRCPQRRQHFCQKFPEIIIITTKVVCVHAPTRACVCILINLKLILLVKVNVRTSMKGKVTTTQTGK